MRVTGAFFEILQTQVFRRRTHAERLASAVDGVRTVIDGGFQSSQIACGSQYFRLVSSLHACSSYSVFPLYILNYSRDTSAASGKCIRGKTHAENKGVHRGDGRLDANRCESDTQPSLASSSSVSSSSSALRESRMVSGRWAPGITNMWSPLASSHASTTRW